MYVCSWKQWWSKMAKQNKKLIAEIQNGLKYVDEVSTTLVSKQRESLRQVKGFEENEKNSS